AKEIANKLCAARPRKLCAAGGGEPMVEVSGKGKGGRMQHLALALSIELARIDPARRICALAAGSDGRDGPTDAAGGFADPRLLERAKALGLDPMAAL